MIPGSVSMGWSISLSQGVIVEPRIICEGEREGRRIVSNKNFVLEVTNKFKRLLELTVEVLLVSMVNIDVGGRDEVIPHSSWPLHLNSSFSAPYRVITAAFGTGVSLAGK